MHEQENIQVVHQAYEAFGRGDVPGVLALLKDDVEWSTPGPPDVIPYAGSRTGHEQVEEYFEAFGGAVEVGEFEPMNFFAEEDMVVVLGHYAFRVKSRARRSIPTGCTPSRSGTGRSLGSAATRTAPPWPRLSPPSLSEEPRWRWR